MEILAARRAAKKSDLFLLDFYLWVKQHVPVKLCIHTYARAARRGTVTSVSIADTLTGKSSVLAFRLHVLPARKARNRHLALQIVFKEPKMCKILQISPEKKGEGVKI